MRTKKEWKECFKERDRLQLQKLKGSNLSCGCGNKGNFGAIIMFETSTGTKHKICGWCGIIS